MSSQSHLKSEKNHPEELRLIHPLLHTPLLQFCLHILLFFLFFFGSAIKLEYIRDCLKGRQNTTFFVSSSTSFLFGWLLSLPPAPHFSKLSFLALRISYAIYQWCVNISMELWLSRKIKLCGSMFWYRVFDTNIDLDGLHLVWFLQELWFIYIIEL